MRKLEDDYHVWINVPVGPKQFRPDYVVLHPGRGILSFLNIDLGVTPRLGIVRQVNIANSRSEMYAKRSSILTS